MTRDEREVSDDLRKIGVNANISYTRNHMKVVAKYKNKEKVFICSKTPSDRRVRMNRLSLVRRWVREIDTLAS
jgi:hypothetical protein